MLHSVWVVPVWVALLVPATFFLTYCLAISQNHVQAFFPYISDTGSFPPESCVFSQLLNISAVTIGLVMYFRHRQIVEHYRHKNEPKYRILLASTIFLWIGYVSAFGVSMVGNFQQTNWLSAHVLGAALAFGFGLMYCWAQTVFSYRIRTAMHRRWVTHFRLFLAVTSSISFFLMRFSRILVTGLGFNPFFNVTPTTKNYTLNCIPGTWELIIIGPEHPGYGPHIATTIGEWIMAIAFMTYFMTYADELRHAVIFPPRLVLTSGQADLTEDGGRSPCKSTPNNAITTKSKTILKTKDTNDRSSVVLISLKEVDGN